MAAYVASEWSGLKDMWRRFTLWRVPAIWWLCALFLPAIWTFLAIAGLGISHGGFGAFDPGGLTRALTPGILIAITTGPLGEEFGWSGFLLPQFLKQFTPLTAALIIGVIRAIWHFPLYHNSIIGTIGGTLRFSAVVVCLSLVMTVIFLKTKTSILIAIVIHWTINVMPGLVQSLFPSLFSPESSVSFSGGWQLIAIALVTIFLITKHRKLLTQKGDAPTRQAAGHL